ncbi:MAG: hypothetical protein ACOZNI_15485, partial [Myxococcota bacterium]
VAFFVEGVHLRLLWGIDLALATLLLRALLPATRWRLPDRAAILDAWTGRNLLRVFLVALFVVGLLQVPLLWSTLALAALATKARRLA